MLCHGRDIVNPTLKEAMLLKDSLNLDSSAPALAKSQRNQNTSC